MRFVETNRGTLVNVDHIEKMIPAKNEHGVDCYQLRDRDGEVLGLVYESHIKPLTGTIIPAAAGIVGAHVYAEEGWADAEIQPVIAWRFDSTGDSPDPIFPESRGSNVRMVVIQLPNGKWIEQCARTFLSLAEAIQEARADYAREVAAKAKRLAATAPAD